MGPPGILPEASPGGSSLPMVGVLVPPGPWEAEVVGVSDRAVSILHADGALVSVVGVVDLMEARAFAHPEGYNRFVSMVSKAADRADGRVRVAWDGATLRAGPAGQDDAVMGMLDFSDALIWDPRSDLLRRARQQGYTAEGSVGLGVHDDAGGGCIQTGYALQAIEAIRQAISGARDKGRRIEGIHAGGAYGAMFGKLALGDDFPANLVGFGPGTTPAGDDWLAGYLAALDLGYVCPGATRQLVSNGDAVSSVAVAAARKAQSLREALAGRLERTTAAGRALLLGSIAGVHPAYLWDLMTSVAGGGGDRIGGAYHERIRASVLRALGHGATSGEDALAGFVAGLACISDGGITEMGG